MRDSEGRRKGGRPFRGACDAAAQVAAEQVKLCRAKRELGEHLLAKLEQIEILVLSVSPYKAPDRVSRAAVNLVCDFLISFFLCFTLHLGIQILDSGRICVDRRSSRDALLKKKRKEKKMRPPAAPVCPVPGVHRSHAR